MNFGKMGALFGRMGSGGRTRSGPFLLLVNGVSHLLLVNGVSRLKILGVAPAPSYTPTYYLLGF